MRLRSLLLWTVAAALVVLFVITFHGRVVAPLLDGRALPVLGGFSLTDFLFYAFSGVTLAGASVVAFSRNILYAALGMLAALLGAGSLYIYLSADFVAVTQLLVYVGGVLVLVLFAVMLTNKITEIQVSNRSFGLFGGVLLLVAAAPVLLAIAILTPWQIRTTDALAPSTRAIGDALLSTWLLPFEVASLVLLATLIGAVVIARKELKADEA
jgi:NAD(P)H-quinone oxidoreductase subunit 6